MKEIVLYTYRNYLKYNNCIWLGEDQIVIYPLAHFISIKGFSSKSPLWFALIKDRTKMRHDLKYVYKTLLGIYSINPDIPFYKKYYIKKLKAV